MEKPGLFKRIFAGKRKYLTIGILVLILAIIAFRGNAKTTKADLVRVSKGDISEEVLVSGTIKPMEGVDLAFEKSGTIAGVYKKTGNPVWAGETIVSLENGAEQAALENAKAQLQSDNARYQELAKGSRPEEIAVKEAELAKATQDLANYYSTVATVINDAYNRADSAVNKQADPIFSNDQSPSVDLTFSVSDQQYKNDALTARVKMTETLSNFVALNNDFLSSDKNQSEKADALMQVRTYILAVQGLLIKIGAVLNSATNVSDATLATYKDNISTGRTNVNTALESVSTLLDNIASQKMAVQKIARELDLKKLGSTAEVLEQQKSAILKSEANVKNAESSLRKTLIRSPFTGVVSKQDAKVGQLASAGVNLVSVISDGSYKIEANIPEADLAKIKVGDKAAVTLDSYGNSAHFEAEIIAIDPAETVIDGVSTYKTTFSLADSDKEIRSGMTANLTIKTAEKKDVLILPQRAISSGERGRVVIVITATGTAEQTVTTGVRSSSGMIEILEGLSEGEMVALPGQK